MPTRWAATTRSALQYIMSTDTIALFDITLEQATAEHLLHVITMQADFATALIDLRERKVEVELLPPPRDSPTW